MNPDRMLNEDVMNEQLSLKFLWEVPYKLSFADFLGKLVICRQID